MKKLLGLAGVILALTTTVAFAGTVGTFSTSAALPAATDVNYVVSKVIGSDFTAAGTGSSVPLSWGLADMQYDSVNNIWTGKHYYAIDLSPSIGTTPAPGVYGTVTMTYTGEINPSGQAAGTGIGQKAVITPVKVVGTTETAIGTSKALKDVGTISITGSSVSGGFLRVYVGLYTGSPVVTNAVPFTNADRTGSYTGTLTITATLV